MVIEIVNLWITSNTIPALAVGKIEIWEGRNNQD